MRGEQAPLKGLVGLHTLTLHCNAIAEISHLDHLRKLQVLDLSSNKIRRCVIYNDKPVCSGPCSLLTTLDLSSNTISGCVLVPALF